MNNVIIENAEIIFPNFSGIEGRYNRKGNRCFSVIVPTTEMAMQLKEEGWNIKERLVNGEFNGQYYINGVNINYDYYRKPIIIYVSNGKEIELTPELFDAGIAGQLDGRGAERYDVSIRPRVWERNDGSFGGVKGYVDEMRIIAKKSLFSDRTPSFDLSKLDDEDMKGLPFN